MIQIAKVESLSVHPDLALNQRRLINLSEEEILAIGSTKWMDAEEINACQTLFRIAFPSIEGLRNVQWAMDSRGFLQVDNPWSRVLQVIHDRKRNHCVLFASGFLAVPVDTTMVLDSLSMPAVAGLEQITDDVKRGITQLMKSAEGSLRVTNIPVQRQDDGHSCGPLAIAFATALAFNLNPRELTFNVPLLRPHLMECLRRQQLTPFPTIPTSPEELEKRIYPAPIVLSL